MTIISPETQKLERYTYKDYAQWNDGIRYELFDGIPYIKYEQEVNGVPSAMAAPVPRHQSIVRELFGSMWQFLKGRRCQVFTSPFDVMLNHDEDSGDADVVFQPDIVVICDPSKIDQKGCRGAPDMVIEVLSTTTRKKDKILKMHKYEQYGVREYWIVDPEANIADVYLLVNGKYMINSYSDDDTAPVMVLPGCEINLKDVFTSMEDWGANESEE